MFYVKTHKHALAMSAYVHTQALQTALYKMAEANGKWKWMTHLQIEKKKTRNGVIKQEKRRTTCLSGHWQAVTCLHVLGQAAII